jgi:hypothetical protein
MGLVILVKSESGTPSFTLHQAERNCRKENASSGGAGWHNGSAVSGSAGFEIPMGLRHLSWFLSFPPDQCRVSTLIKLLPPPYRSLRYDTVHPTQRALKRGKAQTLSDERSSRARRPEGELLSGSTASHLGRLYLSYRGENLKASISLLK